MFLRVIALFFHLSKYCSMHSLIDIVPPVYYISVYILIVLVLEPNDENIKKNQQSTASFWIWNSVW